MFINQTERKQVKLEKKDLKHKLKANYNKTTDICVAITH